MNRHYESFEGAMLDFLYMDSPEALRLIAAILCVHHFREVPPVWLFLIAPSSSAKTEILRPVMEAKFVTKVSQLTTKTLVSGFTPPKPKAGEPAPRKTTLLDRMTERARKAGQDPMMVLKDFTTILNLRADDRGSIMAQLREVKDGSLSGEFGNGITSSWAGRMGFVAAVTDQIEEAIADSAKFGDRYMYYRMENIDPERAIERMIANRTRDTESLVKEASASLSMLGKESAKVFGHHGPTPPAELIRTGGRVNALSILATRLRTPVVRDRFRREITNVYPSESPVRHVSQLTSVASGLMALRDGEWSEDDYPLLRKLALGSAPVIKLRAVEEIFKGGNLSTGECASALSLPKSAVRYPLDDLFVAGLLRRRDPDGNDGGNEQGEKSYVYSLSDETRQLMVRAGYEGGPSNLALAFGGREIPSF